MIAQLMQLVQPETAGDPISGLLWTYRSLSKLAAALLCSGIKVSPTTIGKWLRQRGYALRVNRKCLSRTTPAGRDEQFRHIAALREYCLAVGIPLISVDTKKKELIGLFRNPGATWCRIPQEVQDHDFRSQAEGRAVPYGIYDLQANCGTVFVGDSRDTPAFAVDCIAQWFKTVGRSRYPDADRLVILADCGGSNGYRSNAWKYFLQTGLCNIHQVRVTVAHYPSGTSKWNPIEHRLFSAISRNWAGRPLDSWETMLNYIRTTTTKSGLHVAAFRVIKQYYTGVRITKQQMATVNIERNETQPQWNYDIYPRKKPDPAEPQTDDSTAKQHLADRPTSPSY